ncbi:MAG: PPOX class F420-dependent oxidoreductase [Actinomycetota bacterium]|nr:PPOX class F420-dependent oxidoreductase [Actinomycetota bacterium]
MDLQTAIDWAGARSHAVFITLRKDGRAQSSDITYDLKHGLFRISLTTRTAKAHNMRRDPRVVLHLSDRDAWSYLSFDGTVELTDPTTDPGDATSDALVDYFERVAGKSHPDWHEYRQAMIDERRLLALFTPASVVGQIR